MLPLTPPGMTMNRGGAPIDEGGYGGKRGSGPRDVRHPGRRYSPRPQIGDDAVAAGEMAGADREEPRAGPPQPIADPGRPGGIAVGEQHPVQRLIERGVA